MYKVLKGKVRSVKDEQGVIRIFQEGEILPKDYKPPQDYLDQGIVMEIPNTTKKGDK
jgi:hypothetical protein